jgi:hypothetical protein
LPLILFGEGYISDMQLILPDGAQEDYESYERECRRIT